MGSVLLLAMLPVVGNFAGGLLAEAAPASGRWLSRALHAAAGVVIGVVAVEILPDALRALPAWAIAAAFAAGGLLYLSAEAAIDRFAAGDTRMWMIYLAVATDLFGDGLMIGAGSAITFGLGLTLAVGQVMADVPEGFASILTFRANDIPRRRRLLLTASFALPALAGAAVSYAALRGASEWAQQFALVVTAGLFTVAVFEDMIAEAHETVEDSRISTASFIGGFVAFTLVSAGLG